MTLTLTYIVPPTDRKVLTLEILKFCQSNFKTRIQGTILLENRTKSHFMYVFIYKK